MSSMPLGFEFRAQTLNLSVLSGKNVLIAGGASGIGAAITKKFAENGAYIIVDIQAKKGEVYASELSGQGPLQSHD
jgi:NAD(P)-dependent dehydrogenase (short-subunit alcohol dehydrogenase family)